MYLKLIKSSSNKTARELSIANFKEITSNETELRYRK